MLLDKRLTVFLKCLLILKNNLLDIGVFLMNRRLHILLCYSLENLFKMLQVLLSKMKRRLFSSFLAENLILTPKMTVTLFNLNCFFISNKMVRI